MVGGSNVPACISRLSLHPLPRRVAPDQTRHRHIRRCSYRTTESAIMILVSPGGGPLPEKTVTCQCCDDEDIINIQAPTAEHSRVQSQRHRTGRQDHENTGHDDYRPLARVVRLPADVIVRHGTSDLTISWAYNEMMEMENEGKDIWNLDIV